MGPQQVLTKSHLAWGPGPGLWVQLRSVPTRVAPASRRPEKGQGYSTNHAGCGKARQVLRRHLGTRSDLKGRGREPGGMGCDSARGSTNPAQWWSDLAGWIDAQLFVPCWVEGELPGWAAWWSSPDDAPQAGLLNCEVG